MLVYKLIFSFSKQAFNESSVHRLMNDINLIEGCQAHLPVQFTLNIEFIRQPEMTLVL